MKNTLILLAFLIGHSSVFGQDDSTRMAQLISYGQKIEKGRVVIWLSKNSLSDKRMNGILDTLNLGIVKASELINAPKAWQVFADKPITFFLCDDDFVPHASGDGFVFIPRQRFEDNRALWLHETMHILLRTKRGNWNDEAQHITVAKMPMWLTEGLPEYLAMRLSYENNFLRYDAWKDGGYLEADSSCAAKLRDENGLYVLNFIGKPGVLIELFGKERPRYAPTFYNCSCSFTKYLVDSFGIDLPINAISMFGEEEQTIQKLTSKDLDTLRKQWLMKIGHSAESGKN